MSQESTTESTTTAPSGPPRRGRSGGRIAPVVAGGLVGLVAIALLIGGGALLWGDGEKDDAGYLSTGTHGLHTGTYALATDNLDIDLDGAGWLLDADRLGHVRVQATSRDDKPVFVGIARRVTCRPISPGARTRRSPTSRTGRSAPSTSPTAITPVTSSPPLPRPALLGRLRAGRRLADDDLEGPRRRLVGRGHERGRLRRSRCRVRAGADVPFLGPASWITLGGGLVLLIGAGGLLYLGIRKPPRTRPERVAEREPVVASV